jgi:hypothetical protein
MNIFVLDLDPVKCAQYHVNCHSTKMIVEYSQLLCSAHWMTNSGFSIPYKLSHKNHPCSVWVRECIENYLWLCDLGLSLCDEYTYRYGITPFALAMPDEYKVSDAVEAYRLYYIFEKHNLAMWKNREIPHWFKIK